jgi:hypothetical protein
MTFYSRWTLRWIPELAAFAPTDRVLLWNRAAKAAGQERWFTVGVLMGIVGGLGGAVGTHVAHPMLGSVLGGLVAGFVVTLLMSRPIRRRLNEAILEFRRGTA